MTEGIPGVTEARAIGVQYLSNDAVGLLLGINSWPVTVGEARTLHSLLGEFLRELGTRTEP